MSREMPLLWPGAGSILILASSPPELKRRSSCASGWRFSFASSRKTARLSSILVIISRWRRRPGVSETSKRVGCGFANHGPIGDSWPIAFFGYPRGHRVFIETRCRRHTRPTLAMDTLPRNRASQEPDRSPPGMILGWIDPLPGDAQAACSFRCSASKRTPFFQTVKVIAAILRAKVRRASEGFIPLASKTS